MLPGNDNTVFVSDNASFKYKTSRFLNSAASRLAALAFELEQRAVSIEFGHGVWNSLFHPGVMPVKQIDMFQHGDKPMDKVNPTPVNLSRTASIIISDAGLREALLRGLQRKARADKDIKRSITRVERDGHKSEPLEKGNDTLEIE